MSGLSRRAVNRRLVPAAPADGKRHSSQFQMSGVEFGSPPRKENLMELIERPHPTQNIHQLERLASVIAGGAMGFFGMRKAIKERSIPGAGLVLGGAALIRRGIRGHCDVYR